MKHSHFLKTHGWTILAPLPQDGSARSYVRIEKQGATALFMDCGPPELTRLSDYVQVGNWLRSIGLRSPEIYTADEAANIAIVEDFGSTSVKAAILQGQDPKPLYSAAGDILRTLEQTPCPLDLGSFWTSPMRRARQRLVDWYIPAVRQEKNQKKLRETYLAVWDSIETSLPRPAEGFMHVDFHVENLMVLKDGSLGIIDFQEALSGPLAYDLVNLLEDMRADVPRPIQDDLLKGHDPNFLAWYRVLGTQFHMRLLGQCVRWAIKDNKPHYMQFMPRLEAYVLKALQDPILAPLKTWCDQEGLTFQPLHNFAPECIRPLIADDAV